MNKIYVQKLNIFGVHKMNKRYLHKLNIKNYCGTLSFKLRFDKHKMNKIYVHKLNIFGVHKITKMY
jgi:hypothetical protein